MQLYNTYDTFICFPTTNALSAEMNFIAAKQIKNRIAEFEKELRKRTRKYRFYSNNITCSSNVRVI
jgi:hypothetical protein